ncbi:MAG: hypothetical protein HYR94_28665 [Chloroflexi bacterium]|nr:hypothetical protein [Chloroflexota bacterium]
MPTGITIVGLGPGDSQHWTRTAEALLRQADEVHVRKTRHLSAGDIPAKIYSFDEVYQAAAQVEQALQQIAADVVRLGQRDSGVIYAVPGHPLEDATVSLIRALAKPKQLAVTIIPGLGLAEAAVMALNLERPGLVPWQSWISSRTSTSPPRSTCPPIPPTPVCPHFRRRLRTCAPRRAVPGIASKPTGVYAHFCWKKPTKYWRPSTRQTQPPWPRSWAIFYYKSCCIRKLPRGWETLEWGTSSDTSIANWCGGIPTFLAMLRSMELMRLWLTGKR